MSEFAALSENRPTLLFVDLVLVVASNRSGASMLIDLINHRQVFRFLLKPIQGGQCRIWLNSAIDKLLGGNAELPHPGADAPLGGRFAIWFRSFRSNA